MNQPMVFGFNIDNENFQISMFIDFLLKNNLISDALIRKAIRSRLKNTLRKQKQPDHLLQRKAMEMLVDELKNSPIAIHTADANKQHYEVPAEFYKIVLGPMLKYSCGYWDKHDTSLEQSEVAMLDLTIERADITNGFKVLDVGCGWGSFSLYAAKRFPEKSFTAVSNSVSQRDYIMKQAQMEGIHNLSVVTADINVFDPKENFDRIVSIEMFEHVRNYELLFSKIHKWLTPAGKLFVHIFNHKKYAYTFKADRKSDWMARHFFSGGIMPGDELLFEFSKGFSTGGHWNLNGMHYHRTLEAWLEKMDANLPEVMKIFRKCYGREANKFRAYWRIFFMACSETFKMNNGNEWQVSHYLFEKK